MGHIKRKATLKHRKCDVRFKICNKIAPVLNEKAGVCMTIHKVKCAKCNCYFNILGEYPNLLLNAAEK
jgi:hypothetical protein